MRRHPILFPCAEQHLAGTLDIADGTTALLIVSGGNETRAGAWDGQAALATRIAEAGYPVLRFDRRGVGDSEGTNGGFRTSGPDIEAAFQALRRQCPQVARIVAFGNCDGAAALMLTRGQGCDALVLSNPWTLEGEEEAAPAPEATRAHYRQRLADPAAIRRLLSGEVRLGGLIQSLITALRPAPAVRGLVGELATGIATFRGPIRFLVAERDRTGQTFLARWDKADPRIHRCPGASHSYVEPDAQDWLFAQILEVLRETGRNAG
ncbi:hydrolase 1, exosortase A system-associated [Novosphingobium mangrovi (ex Hu et al. 2023)]|uniref:Hydrolase 1, exosortase A system-associated n=1 Tax=Novosphingobium mangrovi (ex Hu et al. 2023) TaxID=2930094 RepID=A0ABT0A926_9SPHN|nr:hydrolase 1, exosortase A system-associated [Novosphingobium mangrovi (ex Hu et al. 2023)]MCJ1959700.1 hydrolase 1, exosortase A system-associated [Novosphingobium mangrovi (ex Hu et al. 2023)]